MEVLLDKVRIWVKERKPRTSEEAGKLAEDTDKPSCGPQNPPRQNKRLVICVDK